MKRNEESKIESGTSSKDNDWRIVSMFRKKKHYSKVSKVEGKKMRQPNKTEFLNKTSDEQRGSQVKIKLFGRLGFKRGLL